MSATKPSKLLALYGLKWNPFLQDVPVEALLVTPTIESFCFRIEQSHVRDGGFSLIDGDPGTGKSVALRLLAERLSRLRDVTVGEIAHAQSNVADFYREIGDLFDVPLKPHNRWGGFKALRECWHQHIERRLTRPILLIDEAQDMPTEVFREIKSLASTRFDSRLILAVVLAGDRRLEERLTEPDLIALGTRLRTRLLMERAEVEDLQACLEHLVAAAGNAKLMTPELVATICEHAGGNYRVMTSIANELLVAGAERECSRLDEKLYLETFDGTRARKASAPPPQPSPVRNARRP